MSGIRLNHQNVYDEHSHITAKDRPIPVIEIFGPTIQGEGAMIGVKTLFVRFGGCDFRCTKCDSLHAVIPLAVKKHRTLMHQEEIGYQLFQAKKLSGVEWVTFSGGNPAMWDLDHLMVICKEMGLKVAVETQATVWHDWIARCDQITLSPKAPGMGERFDPNVFEKFVDNISKTRLQSPPWSLVDTSLKVVCFSQMDMDFALALGEQFLSLGGSKDELYLSVGNPFPPVLNENFDLEDAKVFGGDSRLRTYLLDAYEVMLEDYLQDPRFGSWKFLPQLHVLLWGNKTGV